jgi:hypothetical protein
MSLCRPPISLPSSPRAPGLAELIVRTVQFGPAEPFFPGLCCIYRGNDHSQRRALLGLPERNRI